MLPTVNVRCTVYDQNGNPAVGSNVSAKLSALEISGGYVLPERVSGVTNAQGEVILALWPNALGAVASHYTFQISNPDTGKTETIIAAIPNNDCELHLVANLPAYAGKTDGQLSVDEVNSAAAVILANASTILDRVDEIAANTLIASTSATSAHADKEAADVSAAAASGSAIAASGSAANALASENTSTAQAVIATAAANTATTKADEAILARTSATASANTATTKATEAATSAAVAVASEEIAVAAADQAATLKADIQSAATVATDNASISTTKANEAAQSAAVAQAAADIASAVVGGAGVKSVNGRGGLVTLGKADVGLANVDNTSDADKPVSTAQAEADAAVLANAGVAAADAATAIATTKANAAQAAAIAASAPVGHVGSGGAAHAVATPTVSGFLSAADKAKLDGIAAGATAGSDAPVLSVAGRVGDIVLAKADVGLGNVDNTSDANKPVSTAQAALIATKVDTSSKDASSGFPGLTQFKLNLRNAADSFTNWLTNATTAVRTWTLPDKDGTIALLSDITIPTLASLGLSNVDNTSDAGKPVSTAQAAALAFKVDAFQKDASGGFAGLTTFKLNLKNSAGTIVSWFTTAATAARTWTLPDKSGTIAMTSDITGINSNTNTGDETNATLLAKLGIPALSGTNTGDQTLAGLGGQATANKDASNGYPGLTLFKVNMKNVAGTFVSWLTNTNTAARTYLFPDKDGTVAMTSDITGTNSGTNSGDETAATIKAKLGIVTLSGSNTGDQVLPTVASLGLTNVAKLDTAQTRTAVETMNPTAASSAAYAWAVNTDPNLTLTTTGNLVMGAPTGLVAGSFYFLEIVYGGAHTVTWNAAFKGVSGISLTSVAAARDAFMFRAQTAGILELVGYRLNVGA